MVGVLADRQVRTESKRCLCMLRLFLKGGRWAGTNRALFVCPDVMILQGTERRSSPSPGLRQRTQHGAGLLHYGGEERIGVKGNGCPFKGED